MEEEDVVIYFLLLPESFLHFIHAVVSLEPPLRLCKGVFLLVSVFRSLSVGVCAVYCHAITHGCNLWGTYQGLNGHQWFHHTNARQ